jgi:hypothetical protein
VVYAIGTDVGGTPIKGRMRAVGCASPAGLGACVSAWGSGSVLRASVATNANKCRGRKVPTSWPAGGLIDVASLISLQHRPSTRILCFPVPSSSAASE